MNANTELPVTTYPALDPGRAVTDGWALMWQNPGPAILYALACLAGLFLINMIPVLGQIAGPLLMGPVTAGFLLAYRKQVLGSNVEFNDFLAGFQYFLPLMITGLLVSIFTSIGFFLLILPGIYLVVAYQFAVAVVAYEKKDFWPAMESSRKLITANWFSYALLALVIMVCNFIGMLLAGLGLIISLPLTMAMLASAYRQVIGWNAPGTAADPQRHALESEPPQG